MITQVRSGEVGPPSDHNPSCPPELDAIILKALARDRENRWDSASDLRSALDSLPRRFRENATDVAAWKHTVIPVVRPVAVPVADEDDEDEETAFRLSTRDLAVEPRMAEGSVRKSSDLGPDRISEPALTQRTFNEEPTRNERPPTDDEYTHVDSIVRAPGPDD